MLPLFALLSFFTVAKAVPQATSSGDCVGTIWSLDDVDNAVKCTTVNVNGFTVPPGETFSLNLLQGSTVNMLGEIQFGNKNWGGPLFEVQGEEITFNGNGKVWDGGGPWYWDGYGGEGGVAKPSPMMQIRISGTLSDVHVVNSPERCFAINNIGPLTVTRVIVDDSQGNDPNAQSKGLPAGRNTDGFDVSGSDLIIKESVVINQDDCLAINQGQNITFRDNYCSDGHGISIGSIGSNVVVENVNIQGNRVVNSMQAFRIKTDQDATNSRVANIAYSDNTATNCTQFGVLITQSYPENFGTAGVGVSITDVSFSPGETDIHIVESGAEVVAVNCGSCQGTWDWSGLKTSGGKVSASKNSGVDITGYNM